MEQFFKKYVDRYERYAENHPRGLLLPGGVISFILGETSFAVGAGAGILAASVTGGLAVAMSMSAAMLGLVFGFAAMVTGVAFSLVGAVGHFLDERRNKGVETVTNEAGQTVQGTHLALVKLRTAQAEIRGLTSEFERAATLPTDVQQKIEVVLTKISGLQKAVVVVDAGTEGADKEQYRFAITKKKIELI